MEQEMGGLIANEEVRFSFHLHCHYTQVYLTHSEVLFSPILPFWMIEAYETFCEFEFASCLHASIVVGGSHGPNKMKRNIVRQIAKFGIIVYCKIIINI